MSKSHLKYSNDRHKNLLIRLRRLMSENSVKNWEFRRGLSDLEQLAFKLLTPIKVGHFMKVNSILVSFKTPSLLERSL
jgi:hypothetical protein